MFIVVLSTKALKKNRNVKKTLGQMFSPLGGPTNVWLHTVQCHNLDTKRCGKNESNNFQVQFFYNFLIIS